MAGTVTHNGANPICWGVLNFTSHFTVTDEGDGRVTVAVAYCGTPLATPSATPSVSTATASSAEPTLSEDQPTASGVAPTPSPSLPTFTASGPTPSKCEPTYQTPSKEQSTKWWEEPSESRPTTGVSPPSDEAPTWWTSPRDPTPSVGEPTPSASPGLCCFDCECDTLPDLDSIVSTCSVPAGCFGWVGECLYANIEPDIECETGPCINCGSASTWCYLFSSHDCLATPGSTPTPSDMQAT